MNDEMKINLINEIGLFNHKKEKWLEFCCRMNQCFDKFFLILSEKNKKDICIETIGRNILRILKDLIRPKALQDPDVTYDLIIEVMEKYFYPAQDSSFYISKFTLRYQSRGETFLDYVAALRKLIVKCLFPKKSKYSKLRNQLINGCLEELKANINPHSMSLHQVFEVGLLWDISKLPKTRVHPRNHKARVNRIRKCFRCAIPVDKHKNESCPFDWAVCSGCCVKGHIIIACKYKEVECNNCKEKGHVKKLCKKQPVSLKENDNNSVSKEVGEKDSVSMKKDEKKSQTTKKTSIWEKGSEEPIDDKCVSFYLN